MNADLRHLGIWLLLAGLLGCGPADDVGPEPRRLAHRFIPQDPAEFLQRTALLERSAVETWSFERPADLEAWEQRRFDKRFELGPDGLILHSSRRRPRLRRKVDWDATSVDALVLEVPGFGRGLGRLYWAREGEQLSEERSLAGRLDGATRPLSLVFDVAFHPGWRGRIRQLAIELFSPQSVEFRLRGVVAAGYRPLAEAVTEAAGRPWKIDLDHEVRGGLLALPGVPVAQRLTVPPAAVLRVGFGTGAGARQQIVFSGHLDLGGGETAVLFETRVDPEQAPRSGRWHDREVDLSAFAGAEATLRLEARVPAGAHDLVDGFSFWANPEVLARAPAASPSPAPEMPNVVLISIDTLRADRLGLYGYPRQTTPNLDAWAKRRATVFTRAVAPSPWTIPSHVSMFSGLDALRHGVNHPVPVPGRLDMMAELFRDAGYGTLAITGGGFMRPRRGFAQGFDRYRYWPDPKSEDELEAGVDRALEWVEAFSDRPFLLFFHTFEVHYPYRRRQPFFTELAGEDVALTPEVHLGFNTVPVAAEQGFELSKEFFWKPSKDVPERSPVSEVELREIGDRYDSGIAYADSRLERLLTRLEARDLDRRTVVIVTSDHGEALGERGLAGHAYLYDWNLLVPLLIATPDGERPEGGRIETQVRTVDLLPTVAELAGLEVPAGLDGASLVPLLEGRQSAHPRDAWSYVSFSNRGLALRHDNRLKYIYNNTAWAPLQGREQLYDLRRDPRELDDLAGTSDRAAELRRQTRARLKAATTALEVRFTNASERAFGGRIAGGGIHATTLKAGQLPSGALTWRKPGVADFRVEPGEDFSLWLERSEGSLAFTFAGEGASGGAFKARLELADLEQPWRLLRGDGGWTEGSGEVSPGATGIAVAWRGGSGPSVAAPAVDAQQIEQLRALGYIP